MPVVTAIFADEVVNRLRLAHGDACCTLNYGDPYQLLVATVLSAQCSDARVNTVTPYFFRRFPSPVSLAASDLKSLEAIIRSTGFFRNKAINLKKMASMLVENYNGQVPQKREQLAGLPGVGPKTANVVLANAFGIPAFAVDTHVYRVARRLGLSVGITVSQVEADLCKLFPKSCWIALHHQLISHGRQTCHARKPNCTNCFFSDMCPTGLGNVPDPHTGVRMVPV